MSELLRILALITGAEPAQVAFWLPPVMASLVALLIFLWAWGMGSMEAGFCAGILASLSPGFLARTMLGYADTDLVTLFLPLLIGLAPAVWVMHFLRHPLALPFRWFQLDETPHPHCAGSSGPSAVRAYLGLLGVRPQRKRAARLVVSGMAFHVPVHRAL